MKAIVVLEESTQAEGQRAIKALYPDAYKMREGVYLITLYSTAKMLSNSLGIGMKEERFCTDQINGVVFMLDGTYSGNWAESVWDWLKDRKPQTEKTTQ